ncbi:MAG: aspartate aminotransferase family protein [Rubrivivax sp.]|jgi:adenosylmethionine-8-amino-7-oxononanoate aminotransferase|nr:aspartate aminotransferase family protein [Rubrivivax sp.]
MTHVFHRHLRQTYPVAVGGDGPYLIDADGRRYLDGSGGAAVSCLGHNHPAIQAAMQAQIERLEFAHTSFFTSEPAEALADDLVAHAPGAGTPEGASHAYFVSGGSEGVEAALKMAVQYHAERGQPSRTKIIARWQSYHGNTLGALSAGGNRWRRAQFADLLVDMGHIDECNEYRGRRADEGAEAYGQRMADLLDAEIRRVGARHVAAFIAEPVVGATMGAVGAPRGYFRRIREICDAHGVLLILDEVMCGMGRCGTLHACEHDGVVPDLEIVAKGLGAGYQPIGAVLVAPHIVDAIRGGSGFFQHGHTYLGHPVACAAALAVQREIRALLPQVRVLGDALHTKLVERLDSHAHVGDIRGRGLFRALEFVTDRDTKAPLPPERRTHARLKARALELGLMCYPMGGTLDGMQGDHVLIAPPFICTMSHLDELVDKLAQAVHDVLPA